FFFFFQAEDGIRDGHVTGVQTCALPILVALELGCGDGRLAANATAFLGARMPEAGRAVRYLALDRRAPERAAPRTWHRLVGEARSEERRVGKECRSRWSPERE